MASAAPSGGWPRPSLRWQLWQARALNSGPSPSEAWVEDGDDTQTLRNSPLPSLKVPSSSKVMLAEDCEKASWLGRFFVVPAPPCISSNCSGLEKSVVGLVIASTRARSCGVRSVRVVGKASEPARAGSVPAIRQTSKFRSAPSPGLRFARPPSPRWGEEVRPLRSSLSEVGARLTTSSPQRGEGGRAKRRPGEGAAARCSGPPPL